MTLMYGNEMRVRQIAKAVKNIHEVLTFSIEKRMNCVAARMDGINSTRIQSQNIRRAIRMKTFCKPS